MKGVRGECEGRRIVVVVFFLRFFVVSCAACAIWALECGLFVGTARDRERVDGQVAKMRSRVAGNLGKRRSAGLRKNMKCKRIA